MRLIVRETSTLAAQYVAQYILDRMRDFAPTSDRLFVLGLPTGSSPIDIYRILAAKYKAGEVSQSTKVDMAPWIGFWLADLNSLLAGFL